MFANFVILLSQSFLKGLARRHKNTCIYGFPRIRTNWFFFFFQEDGIPLCKNIEQDTSSAFEWVPIGGSKDVKNDCLLNNTHDDCIGNITLFENQLKTLKRCQSYIVKREPCVMVERNATSNNLHMLLLLLDVECATGNKPGDESRVDSCLVCFHSVSKENTMQTILTVPSTTRFMPETTDAPPTQTPCVENPTPDSCWCTGIGIGIWINVFLNTIFLIVCMSFIRLRQGWMLPTYARELKTIPC